MAQSSLKDLIHCWKTSPYPSTKISSYFPAYVELFGHLRNSSCTFIETGILGGGSLFMWRKWLGDRARIIGIDLNPEAEKWKAHGFEIFIGDQGDPEFWRTTLNQIGHFDALLDDGGHQSFQQIVTTTEAIKHLTQRSVVVIEDTHTSFMRDFAAHGNRSFLEFAKASTDVLTSRASRIYPNRFAEVKNVDIIEHYKNVFSVQFFGSIVAFKIDPDLCAPPVVAWNMQKSAAADFRYAGKNAATVLWPDPFCSESVVVKGGGA